MLHTQAMYKLLMSLGITPLDGTTNSEHMKEDLAVLSLPELTAQEVEAFSSLTGGMIYKVTWDLTFGQAVWLLGLLDCACQAFASAQPPLRLTALWASVILSPLVDMRSVLTAHVVFLII
eukprot:1142447-Pelagomonas_calceolata.AAC.1